MLRVLGVLAVLVVIVLGAVGVTSGSGPRSAPLGRTDTVVVVAVPGLRWQDLVATDTPAFDAWLGASALMSVRAIGPETSSLEGYLTIGAGNRIEAEGVEPAVVDDRCLPGVLDAARASADDDLNGAEPGALGERLGELGVPTTVFGSAAAIGALMDGEGCVDSYRPFRLGDSSSTPPPAIERGVTLVELVGLEDTDSAAERAAALADIESTVSDLDVPDDALVVVVAPSAPFERAEVTVVGVRSPGRSAESGASLVSPTTRRADYVTLPDLAPAVLAAVGDRTDALPGSMNGTEMRLVPEPSSDRVTHEADLADLAERVLVRDRAVGPVSVVLVVLIVLCAAAAMAGRGRLARTLAPIVIAYPIVAFATGLVAYHQLPLSFVVVMIPFVSAVVAAMVVGAVGRRGGWASVGVLAVLLWLVMVIDVSTGGHLQINTPLGYTPTIAGRFQGFGNLSFGLVGAAAVVTAVLAMHRLPTAASDVGPTAASDGASPERRLAAGVAAFVGAVTTIVVAAPAFGSDVGGTLAVVPTFALLVPMILGRRVGWRPVLAVGAAAVAVVVGLAFVDLARPAESRTHLGRFLDELLHGDGGLVIRRKMRGNLAILTSSFWSFVLLGVLALVVVFAWRRRETVAPAIRRRPPLRVFLTGFAVVGFLGFALNDSGLAVPAIMLAVAVPWVVVSIVPMTVRERG